MRRARIAHRHRCKEAWLVDVTPLQLGRQSQFAEPHRGEFAPDATFGCLQSEPHLDDALRLGSRSAAMLLTSEQDHLRAECPVRCCYLAGLDRTQVTTDPPAVGEEHP